MTGEAIRDAGFRDRIVGNLAVAFGTCVWATHFPVTELLLASWDAFSIFVARLIGSSAVLLTVLLLVEGRRSPLRGVPWARVLLLGALGIGLSTALLIGGVAHAGAVTSGLIAASGPLVGALMARILLGERLHAAVLVGVALAVSGGSLAVLGHGNAFTGPTGGELLILLAVCLWVWYSINAQRWLPGQSLLTMTALTMAAGALTGTVCIGVLAASGAIRTTYVLDARSLSMIVYLSLGPAALSVFLWHYGVRRIGVTVATMYSNLTPVVVVSAAFVAGRHPSAMHILGGVLIIAGVGFAQIHRLRTERRQSRRYDERRPARRGNHGN